MAVTRRSRASVGYGIDNALQSLAPQPIVSQRDPSSADTAEIGTIWCNTSTGSYFVISKVAAGAATWAPQSSGGATVVTDLTVSGGAGDVLVVQAGDTNLAGDLAVGGNTALTGDLTVTGDVTFNGDVDVNSAQALSWTTSANTNPAVSFNLVGGGTTSSFFVHNTTGTSADSIELLSDDGSIVIQAANATSNTSVDILASAGGFHMGAVLNSTIEVTGSAANDLNLTNTGGSVNITATESVSDALTLVASGVAGKVAITGAGGITAATTNSAIGVTSGTGAISISADNAATTVNVGTGANAKTVNIGSASSTSATTILSGSGAIAITAAGGTITANSGTGTIGVSADATATTVNLGTGAGAKTVTLGSTNTTSATTVQSGSGALNITSTNGAMTLASGTGAINVGTDAAAHTITIGNGTGATSVVVDSGTGAINIGTNAVAHTVTVGNVTGASAVVANTGTGGFQLNTTGAGAVDINGSNAVTIDAAAASHFTITGAADLTLSSTLGGVVIGSGEAAADAITIEATAGGVFVDAGGIVEVTPDKASVASPTTSSTQNARVIRATFTGFTTAAAASEVFTINSALITTSSAILVNVTSLDASGNAAILTLDGIIQAAGSIDVAVTNNGGGALGAGDNVLISCWILD